MEQEVKWKTVAIWNQISLPTKDKQTNNKNKQIKYLFKSLILLKLSNWFKQWDNLQERLWYDIVLGPYS